MKHYLLAASFLFVQVIYGAGPGKTDTIERAFLNAFPGASEVKWYKTDEAYQVNFLDNGIDCRMWFRPDGTIERSIRYYTSDHLAPFLLARIVKQYYGKKVYTVTELTSDSGLTYYIILEDDKHWLEIQSDPIGNTVTTKRFKKANMVL